MEKVNLSQKAKDIKMGIYEHYKGNIYQLVGVGFDSETLQEVVIYQAKYGNNDLWTRPIDEFLGSVEINGKIVSRFKYLN